MAIGKKTQAAAKGGSTHNGNGKDVKVEQGDASLENHQDSMTLIDPEDMEGGSTYSSNPVKASTVLAGLEDEESMNNDDSEDDDLEDDEDEVVAEFGDDDADVEPGASEEDDDETDWDAPPADDSDVVDDLSDDSDLDAPPVEASDDEDADDIEAPQGDMTLLDVDGTDDADVSNVAFASLGTNLMVIKANRVIASMNQRVATATNRQDIYLTDQFQQVVASEMNKSGLRMALKTMGFVLAKVDVSSQHVINARVAKEVTKTTAAVRKVEASKQEAFQQSLAIASIGMNLNFFKDTPNELKASLEAELQAAGVRNPNRILSHCFATAGTAYAHSLVTLANKIAAMPKEVRDNYVEAFDMANDIPAPDAGNDEQEAVYGEDEDFDPDFVDEGAPVVASLASPGVPLTRSTISASATKHSGVSLTASAILNGREPLF